LRAAGDGGGIVATPNPEKELQRLRSTLEQRRPPLIVVSGPARFFRDAAIDAVLASVPETVDLRTIRGDEDSDGRELDDLRGAALFGSGTQLVVRRGDAWLKRHGPALAGLLPAMRPGCGLLLEVTKLDKRTKAAKQLLKCGEAFEFRAVYTEPYDRTRSPLDAEMVGWLVDRGRATGVRLQREAALLFMQTVGTDPGECVAGLARLANQIEAPARGGIGAEQLRGVLDHSFSSTPFELAEAVLDADQVRAQRSLEAMFRRGVRGRDGELMDRGGLFPFITTWLYQSFAKAYEGRFLLDRGASAREAASQVGVRVFADRYHRQIQQNPESRLRRGLLLLHQAQRELRLTGEDPLWLLRSFLQRYFSEVAR